MKISKDIVKRKYEDFFISLKNNQFSPFAFYETISLAHAYLKTYHALDFLDERQMQARQLLLQGTDWICLEESIRTIDISKIKTKEEFNSIVKSDYSIRVRPLRDMLVKVMAADENILDEFFRKFNIQREDKHIKESYADIDTKWSVGIVKQNA